MSVQKTIREHMDDLRKVLDVISDHAASGSDDLKQAVSAATKKIGEINTGLDGIFDEALAEIRKSPYTAPIVISVFCSTLLTGALGGWLLRAWVGS